MDKYPDAWYTYTFKFQSYLGKPDELLLIVRQELLDKSRSEYCCQGEQAIARFDSLQATGNDEFNRQQHLEILFKKLKADSERN